MTISNHTLSILIVDDSVVFRSAVAAALEDQQDIKVVGSARNGVKAMEFIQFIIKNAELKINNGESPEAAFSKVPDIITLDVEMPEMDGLETLDEIQKIKTSLAPKFPIIDCKLSIIMLSAYTQKGADITIQALQRGAFDFVKKPAGKNEQESIQSLKLHLLPKIRYIDSQRTKWKVEGKKPAAKPIPPKPTSIPSVPTTAKSTRAILIGVSTGGPNALKILMPKLCQVTNLPIFIVQHMPPVFTKSLAESLNKHCSHTVIEAGGNELIKNDFVYIAPGGKHMLLRKSATGELMAALNDNEPENGCRPSVDVLFRSGAMAFGGNVVSIILTGMGDDGTRGLATLKRSGAYSIVQDEASCVVWGMPGSAVEAGLADEITPLDRIADRVKRALLKV